jgi:hypothetical protein
VSGPQRLGPSRIDRFAECTGDDQWIHVDGERARARAPQGSTIVHGLLPLALIRAAQYELGVYPPDASSVPNESMFVMMPGRRSARDGASTHAEPGRAEPWSIGCTRERNALAPGLPPKAIKAPKGLDCIELGWGG